MSISERVDLENMLARFGDDRVLFEEAIRRLFNEFGDLALPPSAIPDADALAGRLHKLVGSAGMIGATALARAAGAALKAVRADCTAGPQVLERSVAPELRRLREFAAPLLAASKPPSSRCDTLMAGESLHEGVLAELTQLLERRQLEAIDVFARVAPDLKRRLGEPTFTELHASVDALQYKKALELLYGADLLARAGDGARTTSWLKC